jgi:hypothetical protein
VALAAGDSGSIPGHEIDIHGRGDSRQAVSSTLLTLLVLPVLYLRLESRVAPNHTRHSRQQQIEINR